MTFVIQILVSLILLCILVVLFIGILYLLNRKDVKTAIKEVKPAKKQAVIFTDEQPTEEEIAIEREERILRTIGAEK